MFGDLSGNRTVDTLDGYTFRASYNSSSGDAGFVEDLDHNGDGIINTFDRLFFLDNFRSTLDVPEEPAVAESTSDVASEVGESAIPTVAPKFWSSTGLFLSGDRLFSSGITRPVYSSILSPATASTYSIPLWIQFMDNSEEEEHF